MLCSCLLNVGGHPPVPWSHAVHRTGTTTKSHERSSLAPDPSQDRDISLAGQDLLELPGEPIDGGILSRETNSSQILEISVRRCPDHRGKVNVHEQRSTDVVRFNSNPEVTLLQTCWVLVAPEATFDERRSGRRQWKRSEGGDES